MASHVLRVPYQYPLIDEPQYRNVNMIQVETDTGLVGYGIAAYMMPLPLHQFLQGDVAAALVGQPADRPEAVRATLEDLSKKYYTGMWAWAASLVDIALWDLRGKAAGQPIWKLLGGGRERVPVYITFGVPAYDDDQLVEAAKYWVARGFTDLKMAIAGGSDPVEGLYGRPSDDDIREDIKRVAAVREAVGPDVRLAVDGNQSASYAQALRIAKQLEDYDVMWFEDAVPHSDPRLLAQLRRSTSVPIAAGSTGTGTLARFLDLLIHESVDVIQPNVRDIGGFTGAFKAAAVAESFNVTMAMGGGWPVLNAHVHAAVPNGGFVEHTGRDYLVGELFDGVEYPTEGWGRMPTGPGLGLTLKDGALEEFGVA